MAVVGTTMIEILESGPMTSGEMAGNSKTLNQTTDFLEKTDLFTITSSRVLRLAKDIEGIA